MLKKEIEELLPHRKPMLLVDDLEVNDGEVAHGRYTVRGDEWFLMGHFPGNPVVPGVIQCEIIGQVCAILLRGIIEGKTVYYTGLDKVRFKRIVRPGDTIEVEATLRRRRHPYYFAHARATVDDEPCCEGDLSIVVAEGR